MNVSIEDLRAFVEVANQRNFGLAAEALNISLSALSRRIRKTEDAVGARLLDRTTRRVSLSTLGEEFLPEAIRIVDEFQKSMRDVRDLVKVRTGLVSISTNNTIAETILPEILHTFTAKNPGVKIRIKEGSSPRAAERVLSRESEFAIAQYGTEHPDLRFEPLVEDRFDLICHRCHPLAGRSAVSWSELGGHKLVRKRLGSGTSRLLEREVGDQFNELECAFEVEQFHLVLRLVSKNLGYSILPSVVSLYRTDEDLVRIPLIDPTIRRAIGIITPRQRTLSPGGKALYEVSRSLLLSSDLPDA